MKDPERLARLCAASGQSVDRQVAHGLAGLA